MKIRKTLYTIVLDGLSVVTLNCIAFAADSYIQKAEIITLSDEIIKENIVAGMMDEDGKITPLDVNVNLTELPSTRISDVNNLPEKKVCYRSLFINT